MQHNTMIRKAQCTFDVLTFRRFDVSALFLAAALGVSSTAENAHAQSRIPHAPPAQERPVVIHGATIHTVAGEQIDNGYVAFENGRITHLGQGVGPALRGAQRINADGLHVYPGLIALDTELGLTEVSGVAVTVDHSELGRITPEVRAAVAVNPDSDLIPVARAHGGILTALVMPRGGLVSGRASLMRLDGWTWEMMAIHDDVGLVVNWPRTEPIDAWWMETSEQEQRREIAEDLRNIELVFNEAEAYIAAKDHNPAVKTDLRYEAMRAALAGEKPIFVRASAQGQIESAVAWADRRGYNIVIVGGHDADRVIPLLKKHDVPVIITGTHRLPSRRHDEFDTPFTLPAKLHEAGVRFAIAPGTSAATLRNIGHIAATAAAFGLPKDEAIRSVTHHAANILGLDDELGSIAEGKRATLIITDSDPLERTTTVLDAFIDGRRINLGHRQQELHEKYQEKYRQLGLLEGE
jgi:imidazolonepropionase-like amidohydrolase